MFSVQLPPHAQTLNIYTQTLSHAAQQLQGESEEDVESIQMKGTSLTTAYTPVRVPHLSLHVVGAVRRGSGEEGGQVGVERALRLDSERQDLQPRVQTPELLLEAVGNINTVRTGRTSRGGNHLVPHDSGHGSIKNPFLSHDSINRFTIYNKKINIIYIKTLQFFMYFILSTLNL